MADPRNELAEIIVPAAPEAVAAATDSSLFLWASVGPLFVACIVLAAWLWHRRRPARALHAIAAAAAQRQGDLQSLGAQLDVWARTRFKLAWVDAARCPPALDPDGWVEWVTVLEQLRFGPPHPDGFEKLLALCQTARQWRRHA